MNLQFYKLSYILNVRIFWTDIKIKNKFKNKKIEQPIFCSFDIRNFETPKLLRSTFGRSKFFDPHPSLEAFTSPFGSFLLYDLRVNFQSSAHSNSFPHRPDEDPFHLQRHWGRKKKKSLVWEKSTLKEHGYRRVGRNDDDASDNM